MVDLQYWIECIHWRCNLSMISQAAFSSTTSERLILLSCLSLLTPMSHSHRVQLENTNAFITWIFVARVMFLSFQIFERVEVDNLALANRLLISTQLISPWYPKQLSPAPHLKGWYCSPVCLFFLVLCLVIVACAVSFTTAFTSSWNSSGVVSHKHTGMFLRSV